MVGIAAVPEWIRNTSAWLDTRDGSNTGGSATDHQHTELMLGQLCELGIPHEIMSS